MEDGGSELQKGIEKLFGVKDEFIILIVVISQCIHKKNCVKHQIVH